MLEMMATRHRLGLRALTAALLLAGCGGQASGATGASPHPSPTASVSSASLLAYTARGTDLGAGWTDTPSANGTDLTIDNRGHPVTSRIPQIRSGKQRMT